MSVNITVNGKFRACNKPSILDDPVRVKKQLEGELRKQRLLEVSYLKDYDTYIYKDMNNFFKSSGT